jgi:short-subunit dehydrogenase
MVSKSDHDRNAATGADSANEVARVVPLDLAAPAASMTEAAAAAAAALGAPIDILILNGGISSRSAAEDTTIDVDELVMRVNFLSSVALCKACLSDMLARRNGRIVVVSSMQGRVALPFRTSYAASKHALHGFFEALRSEVYDRGVRVTMVLPSYVRTGLSAAALRGSGARHGVTDTTTARGMAPEFVADQIADAVADERFSLELASVYERSGAVCRALWPSLFARVALRKARRGWPAQRAAEKQAESVDCEKE